MSECSYDSDGQYEVRDLRRDTDNLLAELRRTQTELADLKRWFTRLRDRVDAAELTGAR